MRSFLAILTRFMPVMFLIVVLISLFQFFAQHPVTWHGISQTFGHIGASLAAGWHYIGILAAVLWALVILGLRHERNTQRRPDDRRTRNWRMDILDRLTNRRILEDRMREEAEPIFLDAEALARELKGKVIGQDLVCDDIAAQIRRRLALRQRGKPVGVFLLAGPPGTGKTYLAKRLASALKRPLIHLDMTQFARGGAAGTQLFGSSKGYVGSDTYGKLTASLRETPASLVLLDEFEKAHPEVHKNFLTAWNDGFITEASDGKQISTTQAIFVLTTNAAIEALTGLAERHAANQDELRKNSTQALLDWGFAPELLNRIDRIFVFKFLKGLDIARVGALEIESMINNYGLEIVQGGLDPELLYSLVRRQQRVGTAASSRDLVRAIEETIADSLINAKKRGAQKIALAERDGVIVATPVNSASAPGIEDPKEHGNDRAGRRSTP